jgi:RimJ/RimL family protein N-acetyltransferase
MHLYPHLVRDLPDIMIVREIRNECCEFMTRHQQPIRRRDQLRWFLDYYEQAVRKCEFRIWLFATANGQSVGYGSLKEDGDHYWVTEAVAKNFRGNRAGTEILQSLIRFAQERPLRAEIWSDNVPSIRLHERAGFTKCGSEHRGDKVILHFTKST